MARRLDAGSSDFERAFADLLGAKREVAADVDDAVATIIADVVARGGQGAPRVDPALRPARSRRSRDRGRGGRGGNGALRSGCAQALQLAHRRIEAFHRAQLPADHDETDALGVRLGWRWTAVEAVGLYVPGGTASYPSSVLMNAVPAKVAGVSRIVMVVPTPEGELNRLVLAAARLAGVDEIYRVGGAQAIAALAFGTETIRPVAKIVGPATPMWRPRSAVCSVRSEST
jgi:histidinol dehydrogenase